MKDTMKNFELDNWSAYTKDLQEFGETVSALNEKSTWNAGITSSGLRTEAVDGPIEAEGMAKKCGVSLEVAHDTAENTKLMLRMGSTFHCLRDTAIPSLYSTAKIMGSALGRLSPFNLSSVLNTCLDVARGSSLVLYRGDKISAIMSDRNGGYKIMPQPELFDITTSEISNSFGAPQFIEGTINHHITSCMFELPLAQERLNEAYNKSIAFSGRSIDLMPAVRFLTSDTGDSAAILLPMFRQMETNVYYPINRGLKVDHIRAMSSSAKDGVEKFAEIAKQVHAKFYETGETIVAMAKTNIMNPLNAYVAMTNKIGLAQRYAKAGYEDLERFCLGRPCTMHDIYLSMTVSINAAYEAGLRGSRLMAIEDAIAKVLILKWADFDYPGNVSWNASVA